MIGHNIPCKKILQGTATALGWISVIGWTIGAQAVTFQPPPESQAPQQTSGGASRNPGQCVGDVNAGNEKLTALVPKTNNGITVAEHPTIYVYVPPTAASEVYFSIEDENRQPYFQTNIPIIGGDGIVAVQIPKSLPAMTMGKDYQWHFVLKCAGVLAPRNPIASGWIRRVPPTPIAGTATPEELATSYGQAGIWYDTLSTLIEARQVQPQNETLAASLQELLNSVGIEEMLGNAPLVGSFRAATGEVE